MAAALQNDRGHAMALLLVLRCFLLVAGDADCPKRGGGTVCCTWCSQWTCEHPSGSCDGCGPEIGCQDKPPPPPSPPPQPAIPPWKVHATPGFLTIYGHEGVLYANGEPLSLKGVNWFGSENRMGPPLGLDKHDIGWYMTFLRDNGFNAIRLLFNHEGILTNATLEPPDEAKYGAGAPWEAPELQEYGYLEMFARLAEVAAEHGILILMACHRLRPDAWPGDGLWYDEALTEARVLESWGRIAARLCGQWNIFAVDLQNEPHKASWGKGLGEESDWGHAAERIGTRATCATEARGQTQLHAEDRIRP